MKKVFVLVAAMICSSSMVSNAGVSNLNNEKNNTSIAPQGDEISVELKNKSGKKVEVSIKAPKGRNTSNFSLNGSTTKKVNIEVGSTIFVNGAMVLTVSAGMNKTEQIIAR